ncbi:MAG: hypothetical protein QM813_20375 [Verrucomicrobiota bacterium]
MMDNRVPQSDYPYTSLPKLLVALSSQVDRCSGGQPALRGCAAR